MPCMVIIVGYGTRRSAELTQSEITAKSSTGSLMGGCPTCIGGRVATYTSKSPVEVTLATPGTTEMYIVSFSGTDAADAELNAKSWLVAESDWLDQSGKTVNTFTY